MPEVRELAGLTYYRLERWQVALAELEMFTEFTGATHQLPTMADCCRALGAMNQAAEYWQQLRTSDADEDTMAEGRIVAAAALADQGNLPGAISLLAKAPLNPRVLAERHLRTIYALADLYERDGDTQRARRGFERIANADPAFYDVERRLRTLGAAS